MNTQDIQIKYDILLTQISAVILVLGIFISLFHESPLSVILLPLVSAVGLLFLLAYLLTAMLFLESCDDGNDTMANRAKLATKCCQWMFILMAVVVIALLAIM